MRALRINLPRKGHIIFGLLMAAIMCVQQLPAQDIDMEQNLLMIHANGGTGLPGADLAERFGMYGKAGAALSYRFSDNWYASFSGDFIFGGEVRDSDALDQVMTESGRIIGTDGILYLPELQMRGWQFMAWGGKLFPLNEANKATGVLTMIGAGFLQHKINYFLSESGTVPQITGDYAKGYDRLSNGFCVAEYIGYHYMSTNRLINFNIGLEMVQGFTANRRGFDYGKATTVSGNHFDLMFNLKFSWILPFYKRDKIEVPDQSDF